MDRKAEALEATRQHASRTLHVYPDEDGTVRIRGRLAPEVGVLLMKALDAARETLYRQRRDQAPDVDLDVGYAIDVLHPLAADVAVPGRGQAFSDITRIEPEELFH